MNEHFYEQLKNAVASVYSGASKVTFGTLEADAKVYACGTIIRIDIKPKNNDLKEV